MNIEHENYTDVNQRVQFTRELFFVYVPCVLLVTGLYFPVNLNLIRLLTRTESTWKYKTTKTTTAVRIFNSCLKRNRDDPGEENVYSLWWQAQALDVFLSLMYQQQHSPLLRWTNRPSATGHLIFVGVSFQLSRNPSCFTVSSSRSCRTTRVCSSYFRCRPRCSTKPSARKAPPEKTL